LLYLDSSIITFQQSVVVRDKRRMNVSDNVFAGESFLVPSIFSSSIQLSLNSFISRKIPALLLSTKLNDFRLVQMQTFVVPILSKHTLRHKITRLQGLALGYELLILRVAIAMLGRKVPARYAHHTLLKYTPQVRLYYNKKLHFRMEIQLVFYLRTCNDMWTLYRLQ
jgi:hypothetical protein